jgi:YD repeat-containing protein
MKLLFATTILTFAFLTMNAQTNQLNEKGKRNGDWKIYLDKNWKEVKDTNMAVYTRFAHYENGYETTMTGNRSDAKLTKPLPKDGKELLNGEYKWNDKEGQLKYVDVFENGRQVTFTYYKNGKMTEETDYRIKWRDQPNTYRMTVYKKDKTEYFFMRNGPKGWMGYAGAADGK